MIFTDEQRAELDRLERAIQELRDALLEGFATFILPFLKVTVRVLEFIRKKCQ